MSTNAERAMSAERAFRASDHARENNDDITNLYDFVCDLMHLADELVDHMPDREDVWDLTGREDETPGQFVSRMALYHYDAELQEEEEENAQG